MPTLQHLNLFLHLLAAITWIGGTIFLTFVGPKLRTLGFADANLYLRTMNRSFKVASWHAVVLLLVTGVGNLWFQRAFDDFGAYLRARPAMHAKLAAVLLMIVLKFVHDFVTGPRAAAAAEAGTAPERPSAAWKATMFLARANLVLGLLVVYLAILVR
jgi:uncharacterized membrane protein